MNFSVWEEEKPWLFECYGDDKGSGRTGDLGFVLSQSQLHRPRLGKCVSRRAVRATDGWLEEND